MGWDSLLKARTHGQAASPTRLGKEVMVLLAFKQMGLMNIFLSQLKFGGATKLTMHHLACGN